MFPSPRPQPQPEPPIQPPLSVVARQLSIPKVGSPPPVTNFLYDPTSLSLAISHSDSSFSLFPSLSPSPLSLSSLPRPHTLIPPPSSSATFLHLTTLVPSGTTGLTSIFLVSSPTLGGTAVLLRFYLYNPTSKSFMKAKITCNHRDLSFDDSKHGVVFRVSHGVSVRLVGSTNVFAIYSASNARVWVFSVRLVESEVLKMMKCAVIDCSLPVFAISVSFGYLLLGEEKGVRVFPLRPLVKGKVKKERKLIKRDLGFEKDGKLSFQNGVIQGINGVDVTQIASYGGKNVGSAAYSNGQLEQKTEKRSSVRLSSLKLRQDSKEVGACFVALKSEEIEGMKVPRRSVKAVCIQALSPEKFLILDSVGDMHFLCFSNPVNGSEISFHVQKLKQPLRILKLAVFPDPSARTQYIWMSDGHHTVHIMEVLELDASRGESDGKDSGDKLIQTSVKKSIFSGGKIQEIVAFTPTSLFILSEGRMTAFDVS